MVEQFTNSNGIFEHFRRKNSVLLAPQETEIFRDEVVTPHRSPILSKESMRGIRKYLKDSKELPFIHESILSRTAMSVPSLVEDFVELGIYEDLIDADLSGKRHGVWVEWNSAGLASKCSGGVYYYDVPKISLSFPQPDFLERTFSLATKGRVHTSLLILGHEFTHRLQHLKFMQLKSKNPKRELGTTTELREAQAYLVSDPELSMDEIFNKIRHSKYKNGEYVYPGIDEQKLRNNIESFKLLNSLGTDQKEIAELVANPGKWISRSYGKSGVWSEPVNGYINIIDRIEELKRKTKLTNEEIIAHDLVYSAFDREKVKGITFNHLRDLLGENLVRPA